MIYPYCGAEMELWKLWHSKWGVFYEGYKDLVEYPENKKINLQNKVLIKCRYYINNRQRKDLIDTLLKIHHRQKIPQKKGAI